jgi:large conductance mechanosensitive channel
MWEEFKKFAMRGNVIDLAVGVIIGAAFGAIVTSLVGDIIMPVVGAVTGGLDFTNYYTPLSAKVDASVSYADAKKQGAVLGWGQFLTAAINFLIIAWVLFIAIKGINRLKREEPAAAWGRALRAAVTVGPAGPALGRAHLDRSQRGAPPVGSK